MKLICTIIVLTLCSECIAQEHYSSDGGGIEVVVPGSHLYCIDVIMGKTYDKTFYSSAILPFVWTTNDRFNHDRFNMSATPLINQLFIGHSPFARTIIADAMLFPNSKLTYLPFSSISKRHRDREGVGFVVKNTTNVFVFRNKKWIDYSPGVGLFVKYKVVYSEFGLNYHLILVNTNESKRSYYLAVGMSLD